MAVATRCQTPGAQYATQVDGGGCSVGVTFPWRVDLTKEDAKLLESNLHNVVELVLAPLFVNGMTRTLPASARNPEQEPERVEIVDGPAKWELLLGLMDNTSENPRTVTFTVYEQSGRFKVDVSLDCLERDTEDGEFWGFEGEVFGPSYLGPKSVSVTGSYSTKDLEGYMVEVE